MLKRFNWPDKARMRITAAIFEGNNKNQQDEENGQGRWLNPPLKSIHTMVLNPRILT